MEISDERSWPARALDYLEAHPGTASARALLPLGAVYEAGAAWLRRMRPDRPLPDPPRTFGVGNVRVGGTGKTPVVADLARRLANADRRVAVVTRGYRAEGGGDEPGWLAGVEKIPVIVDPFRRRAVERARREGAEVVLLDDALQTPDRPRDCLALILEADLDRPPRVLPAGPAREAVAAGMARASAVAVRVGGGVELAGWVERSRGRWERRMGPQSRVLAFRLSPFALVGPQDEVVPLTQATALSRCLLLSGLARPSSFEADCRETGLEAVASLRWDDHCDPGPAERDRVAALAARHRVDSLVCPEKNLARLRALDLPRPIWALRSRIEWDPAEPLSRLGLV